MDNNKMFKKQELSSATNNGTASLSSNYKEITTNVFLRIPGLKWSLVIIPLAFMLLVLFFPLLGLFKLTFFDETGFTLEYVNRLFSDYTYLRVTWLTLKLSFLTTIVCILISYPIAYLAVKVKSRRWESIIIALATIPFWISLIVRSFSWIVILQKEGVITYILKFLGFNTESVTLLYNSISVVIGMSHVMYPFMFFCLYSVMKGIDQQLPRAAEGLGARPIQSFFQIFLPLSLPGILAGSLLVFVMSLGFFVVPALLGGSNDMMISVVIENYVNKTLNWHLASALSLMLFIITMIILFITVFILRNHALLKDVT